MKDFDIWDIERMAVRFNPKPTFNVWLDSRYEWQKMVNNVEWPYYRFFYHLAKTLQPELVVELGGWQGTAAAHFAKGQIDGQDDIIFDPGITITVDHHTDPGDEHNQEKMIEATEQVENIIYVQGWTNPEIANREKGKHHLGDAPDGLSVIKNYPKIDILFIDSWHTYDNALLDWKYYKPLLNSPALIICDDIQDGEGQHDPISGMMRFWNEMPEPKFLNSNLHPGTNMGFIKML